MFLESGIFIANLCFFGQKILAQFFEVFTGQGLEKLLQPKGFPIMHLLMVGERTWFSKWYTDV